MSRPNYKQKIAEGVLHFTSYEVQMYGETFVLKCEAIKDPSKNHGKVIERPYSFKKKGHNQAANYQAKASPTTDLENVRPQKYKTFQ